MAVSSVTAVQSESARVPEAGPSVQALGGVFGGLVGTGLTNNLVKSLSNWQNNQRPWADMSFVTARARLFGSMLQTASTYAFITALRPACEGWLGREAGGMAANGLGGGLGGFPMHVATVGLLLKTPEHHNQRAFNFPALRSLGHLCLHQPAVFARGLGLRFAMSALDWGVYLGVRDALPAPGVGEALGAAASMLVTTPIYQLYVWRIATGRPLKEGRAALFSRAAKAGGGGLGISAAFLGVFMGERLACDYTQRGVVAMAAMWPSRGSEQP